MRNKSRSRLKRRQRLESDGHSSFVFRCTLEPKEKYYIGLSLCACVWSLCGSSDLVLRCYKATDSENLQAMIMVFSMSHI
jgi:hypothetical protein